MISRLNNTLAQVESLILSLPSRRGYRNKTSILFYSATLFFSTQCKVFISLLYSIVGYSYTYSQVILWMLQSAGLFILDEDLKVGWLRRHSLQRPAGRLLSCGLHRTASQTFCMFGAQTSDSSWQSGAEWRLCCKWAELARTRWMDGSESKLLRCKLLSHRWKLQLHTNVGSDHRSWIFPSVVCSKLSGQRLHFALEALWTPEEVDSNRWWLHANQVRSADLPTGVNVHAAGKYNQHQAVLCV